MDDVAVIRAHIIHYTSFCGPQFEPLSLAFVKDVINRMKPSTCPTDVVPPHFLKEVFYTIGPVVQEIINSSLTLGAVPLDFKHVVVQPLKKNINNKKK